MEKVSPPLDASGKHPPTPTSYSTGGLNFNLQADVAPITGDISTDTHAVVAFHDAANECYGGYSAPMDSIGDSDRTANVEMNEFFSRPVRIFNFTWNESDTIKTITNIAPWNLYFTDARVQYKLNNYAFIRAKLKVKILINASPFYYGAMMALYTPLQNLVPNTVVTDPGNRELIPYSQRPHVWLNPQNNEGATMEFPFFYHQNWLNASSANDMLQMGQLSFVNYTTLQSANGAVGTGVSIAVYAWAEDVELSGPTVALSTQGDEYGKGPVSSVATAIAKTAGKFSSVPFIGRFATATRIGASAVSSIASLFGFTNVPVIADTAPFRPEPYPKLASTASGFPIEKLTVDPKNELAIDPSVTGAKSDDELVISTLVQKESYLNSITWASTDAVDKLLYTAAVSPVLFDVVTATASSNYYMPPMCWISNMFNHWRGDIIFKFKIVASTFHKGRLRISFDPAGISGNNITNTAASSNVVFTEIVDLGESNEVEFRIPYQQATSFLYLQNGVTNANLGWSTSTSPLFLYSNGGLYNGTITVRVQTALTAPVASTSLSVLVFVRGAENLEFANPNQIPQSLSMFAPQSDVIDTKILGTGPSGHSEERNLVNFGEQIMSLRTLMRRYNFITTDHIPGVSTAIVSGYRKSFSRRPLAYGYDATGVHSAKGLIATGSNFPFNYVTVNPITYVMPAFIGYRGSINWTANHDNVTGINYIAIARDPSGNSNVASLYSTIPGTSTLNTSVSGRAAANLNAIQGAPGMAMVSQRTNAGINVQLPNLSQFRFQFTSPKYASTPIFGDGSLYDMAVAEVIFNDTNVAGNASQPTTVHWYAGIGTDFSLVFFLNVPTYLAYNSVPIAN